jgi:hypothetical protein
VSAGIALPEDELVAAYGIGACGFESGASPANNGAGPVMLGTAFAIAGTVGGVVTGAAPLELPAAVASAPCTPYKATPPRAITAPPPTIAAHSRILRTTFWLITVYSIAIVGITYTLVRVKDSLLVNAANLESCLRSDANRLCAHPANASLSAIG